MYVFHLNVKLRNLETRIDSRKYVSSPPYKKISKKERIHFGFKVRRVV